MAENAFSEIDYYRMLFEFSVDPQYVLDRDEERFIMVNNALIEALGYSEEELLSGKVKPMELIHPEDRERVSALYEADNLVIYDCYEARVFKKTGEIMFFEFTVHNLEMMGRRIRIGSLRDIGARKRLEKLLKEEIGSQKRKTIETAKSTVRVGQLLEKIKKTPELTTQLLDAEDETDLFRKTGTIITDPEGFNAESAVFFLKKENFLEVAYSTSPMKRKRFDLSKNSKYAREARGETPRSKDGKVHEEGYPIVGKDRLIGLMHVNYNPSERFLFDDSATIRKGLRDLTRTISSMLSVMIDNIRLFRKVQEQAIVDQVTGAYNRRYFDQKVKDEFVRATRYGRSMALVIIDIDKFKNINDTYGHLQGDQILREVADIFKDTSREIDIICRYGGDEFVMLLPETGYEEAIIKAEKLRKLVARHKFRNITGKKPFKVTLSIGVTSNIGCKDERDLFTHGDKALYKAKGTGRNKVVGAAECDEE